MFGRVGRFLDTLAETLAVLQSNIDTMFSVVIEIKREVKTLKDKIERIESDARRK